MAGVLPAIIEIRDSSGNRVDLPTVDGMQQPIVLQLGDNISHTSKDGGDGTTIVEINANETSSVPGAPWSAQGDLGSDEVNPSEQYPGYGIRFESTTVTGAPTEGEPLGIDVSVPLAPLVVYVNPSAPVPSVPAGMRTGSASNPFALLQNALDIGTTRPISYSILVAPGDYTSEGTIYTRNGSSPCIVGLVETDSTTGVIIDSFAGLGPINLRNCHVFDGGWVEGKITADNCYLGGYVGKTDRSKPAVLSRTTCTTIYASNLIATQCSLQNVYVPSGAVVVLSNCFGVTWIGVGDEGQSTTLDLTVDPQTWARFLAAGGTIACGAVTINFDQSLVFPANAVNPTFTQQPLKGPGIANKLLVVAQSGDPSGTAGGAGGHLVLYSGKSPGGGATDGTLYMGVGAFTDEGHGAETLVEANSTLTNTGPGLDGKSHWDFSVGVISNNRTGLESHVLSALAGFAVQEGIQWARTQTNSTGLYETANFDLPNDGVYSLKCTITAKGGTNGSAVIEGACSIASETVTLKGTAEARCYFDQEVTVQFETSVVAIAVDAGPPNATLTTWIFKLEWTRLP